MMTHITTILQMVAQSFLHTWPYLLLTIPLAVAVQMTGAARYIKKALNASPFIAIMLATLLGAFSPFCSCGVIPVIASLLIGGVPLGPVMSFWIASPSMDVEVFFLSVAALNWDLAVWRMTATLLLSFSAGLITHLLMDKGWLGKNILRSQTAPTRSSWGEHLIRWGQTTWTGMSDGLRTLLPQAVPIPAMQTACCDSTTNVDSDFPPAVAQPVACGCRATMLPAQESVEAEPAACGTCQTQAAETAGACGSGCGCGTQSASQSKRLVQETLKAVTMVVKFMTLAFFLNAVIALYVPEAWIAGLVGKNHPFAVLNAALIGIPAYTSNLTALPMIGGLLGQGMNPGAALAFLIAGPTTTLPAMAAVWGLTTRRVFALYVGFSFFGALLVGTLYNLLAIL